MLRSICTLLMACTLACSATMTSAQARPNPNQQRQTLNGTGNRQQTLNQPGNNRQTLNQPGTSNAARQALGAFVPARGYIHRMQLVKSFARGTSAPARNLFTSRNMAPARIGTGMPTGAQTMDRKTNLNANKGLTSMTGNSRINTLPMITKIVNGVRVSYQLQSPEQTSTWTENAQLKPNPDGQGQDKYDPTTKMNCHPVILSFDCQSKSFMTAQPEQQGSLLMPGMVFTYEDICNGNLTHSVLNNNRLPVTLFVDATSRLGGTSVNIPNPTGSSINDGIETLRKNFGGDAGGGDVMYQLTKTENQAEQNLAVTAGGSYGGFSGKASFTHTDSNYHMYYTIDAIKELYTINVQPDSLSLYPQGYNLPANGFPVMIANVTYGARVLANMDITFASSSNTGGLDFQYTSIGSSAFANLQAGIQQKQCSVTINGILVGFPAKFGGTFSTDLNGFLGMMNVFFSGCDYNSSKPLQYTFANLQGDEMGITSITDKTTIQECTPADQTFTLRSVNVTIKSGEDDKNDNSEFWLSLATGNEHSPHWVAQIYDNHSKFNKSGNDYTLSFPTPAPVDMDEFDKNGGLLAFKLIGHGHSDDWDFAGITLTFNFMSQHGLVKQKVLNLANFRISDTDGSHDSKDVLFHSTGDNYASN